MTDFAALLANACIESATLPLSHCDLPIAQVVAGSPRVGSLQLGRLDNCAIGVWEHTCGVSRDVEVDEFFIVLSGTATVAFDDGSLPLQLHTGSIGRLAAGSATTWSVTATLRKIYVA